MKFHDDQKNLLLKTIWISKKRFKKLNKFQKNHIMVLELLQISFK